MMDEGKLIGESQGGGGLFVKFGSDSLGDSIAWIGVVEDCRKNSGMKMTVMSNWGNLFKRSYPNITFVDKVDFEVPTNPTYRVGGFDEAFNISYSKEGDKIHPEYLGDVKKLPLQEVAIGFLGYIPKSESGIRTKILKPNGKKQIKAPYVTISTQSTAQCKYWNYPNGWNILCQKLRKNGLTPVCVDKFENFGVSPNINHAPKKAVKKFGKKVGLEGVMNYISHAEFHIGTSSGLSWLAWALEKPVVCIQGLTYVEKGYHPEEWTMVENRDGCHGCFNKHEFDSGEWMFCPENKNFECTRDITPTMVLNRIREEGLHDIV